MPAQVKWAGIAADAVSLDRSMGKRLTRRGPARGRWERSRQGKQVMKQFGGLGEFGDHRAIRLGGKLVVAVAGLIVEIGGEVDVVGRVVDEMVHLLDKIGIVAATVVIGLVIHAPFGKGQRLVMLAGEVAPIGQAIRAVERGLPGFLRWSISSSVASWGQG